VTKVILMNFSIF